MAYTIIKAIHIIFIVSYFAGLFYIVRLIIYHTETQSVDEPERSIMQKQYRFMENRLWNIITVPAGIFTLITGIAMLCLNTAYLTQGWMHIKLTFVVLLIIYHFWVMKMLRQIKNNIYRYTSIQLRMLNEVATLLLFIIVFAVVLKTMFIQYWHWVFISFLGVGILIMLVVKMVNKTNK